MKIKIKQFLTNTADPKSENARLNMEWRENSSPREAWESHLHYLSDKIIGKPQGTSRYSSQQLENEGMVGVYKEMGLREWLSYRVMLINHWYKKKFIYMKYKTVTKYKAVQK